MASASPLAVLVMLEFMPFRVMDGVLAFSVKDIVPTLPTALLVIVPRRLIPGPVMLDVPDKAIALKALPLEATDAAMALSEIDIDVWLESTIAELPLVDILPAPESEIC